MLSQEGSGEREKSCQSELSPKVGVVVTVRKCDQEDMSLDASWGVLVCDCGLGARDGPQLRRRARRGVPRAASPCDSGL